MTSSFAQTREAILTKYNIAGAALLGKGMEAEVYALSDTTVLKIYHSIVEREHLITLQDFYASLDARQITYQLPEIHQVEVREGLPVTIEKRLTGTCLGPLLFHLDQKQVELLLLRTLSAGMELSRVRPMHPFSRYKLYDEFGFSAVAEGDWYQFLKRYILKKMEQMEAFLARDVADFSAKRERLLAALSQPYRGEYTLIHGDFFPGNLLVNDTLEITGLLDFGVMTMFGDSLFEIATGWLLFDMYDELRLNLRQRYLEVILETLGESVRETLCFYALIYSILSANLYSPDCSDGHYAWCVHNLNNPAYWQGDETFPHGSGE